MKSFFSSFFAALLAILVFSIGGVMLLIGFAAAFSSDVEVTVPTNAVLVIDLNDNFTEKELGEKILGLSKALNSDGFANKVGSYQFDLLNVQHGAMITYRRVLIMRINDLSPKS